MLKIKIGNIEFCSPVIASSGTFGYGDEVKSFVDISKLGGIVTKSITSEPRLGNSNPRILESESGMLNAIGLANIGVNEFCNKKIPLINTLNTNIIVSVAGSTIEDYVNVVKEIENTGGNHIGYEINISCPNTKKGGVEFGKDSDMTLKLTKSIRSLTDKLLIVKLSPNVTSIENIALAAEKGGADAISAINTVVGMAIDINTQKYKLSNKYGGLSGPAIRPIAIANVHKIFNVVSIPVIGIGGVRNSDDVIEFMLAGASLVQVGTMNYLNPAVGVEISANLIKHCRNKNIFDISKIIGKVDHVK